MAVTREQFDAGMTYDAYKAQMTRNQEQFEQNEKDLQLSAEEVAAFKGLPQTVNVLAPGPASWPSRAVASAQRTPSLSTQRRSASPPGSTLTRTSRPS